MTVLIALAFLVGLPLAAEVGARLHGPFTRGEAPDASGATFLSGSALGLLGLLVGFTFAMASERFEARRALVVSEANAISTVYLRDSLLGSPYDDRLERLVDQYAEARVAFFDAGESPGRLAGVARRTADLQDAIWAATAEALKSSANAPLVTAVLSSTNDMFDLAATREAAREATVPEPIIWAVALCAFATAAICGYGLQAGGHRHRFAATGLLLLVAVALLVIEDINSPRGGLIRAPQGPLVRQAADLAGRERIRLGKPELGQP